MEGSGAAVAGTRDLLDHAGCCTQAIERFTATGMDWYAIETSNLLAARGSSGNRTD
jgi:hypothetical protein